MIVSHIKNVMILIGILSTPLLTAISAMPVELISSPTPMANAPAPPPNITQRPTVPLASAAPSTASSAISSVGVISYAPIIKVAAPAVVSIIATQLVKKPIMGGNPDVFRDFFDFFKSHRNQFGGMGGGMQTKLEKSLGSGVILDASGYIVTCLHVVQNAKVVHIKLSNEQKYEAEIAAIDPNHDLAILRVKPLADGSMPQLTAIPIADQAKTQMQVGDVILAIGNPFGIGQTVSSGIISGMMRIVKGHLQIQTDASINPGNSGGALINMQGELIAIPNAILSKSGASHGIGFAIPAHFLYNVLKAAKNGGALSYAWSGIDIQEITTELAVALKAQGIGESGVLVRLLHSGSPAVAIGLQQGDVITKINGQPINSDEEYMAHMETAVLGQSVTLSWRRIGVPTEFQSAYIPIDPPALPEPNITRFQGNSPLNGIAIANLSPKLAMENGLPDTKTGVVILDASASILSSSVGLKKGNLLISINNRQVQSVADVSQLIGAHEAQRSYSGASQPLIIGINRGQDVIQLRIG